MIDKPQLYLLAQIISGMEDAVVKLEESYTEKKVEDFEESKKTILDFQKKLAGEIEKVKRK